MIYSMKRKETGKKRGIDIIMKVQKNYSLFKNDLFGIKSKVFIWRIAYRIKKRNHFIVKGLECLLNLSMSIGIPDNEEDVAKLEWICDKYKSLMSEIESDMKHVSDKIYYWRND